MDFETRHSVTPRERQFKHARQGRSASADRPCRRSCDETWPRAVSRRRRRAGADVAADSGAGRRQEAQDSIPRRAAHGGPALRRRSRFRSTALGRRYGGAVMDTSPAFAAPDIPFPNLSSGAALGWIVGLAVFLALLWFVPIVYDNRQANKWRAVRQAQIIDKMLDAVAQEGNGLSVEEVRQRLRDGSAAAWGQRPHLEPARAADRLPRRRRPVREPGIPGRCLGRSAQDHHHVTPGRARHDLRVLLRSAHRADVHRTGHQAPGVTPERRQQPEPRRGQAGPGVRGERHRRGAERNAATGTAAVPRPTSTTAGTPLPDRSGGSPVTPARRRRTRCPPGRPGRPTRSRRRVQCRRPWPHQGGAGGEQRLGVAEDVVVHAVLRLPSARAPARSRSADRHRTGRRWAPASRWARVPASSGPHRVAADVAQRGAPPVGERLVVEGVEAEVLEAGGCVSHEAAG